MFAAERADGAAAGESLADTDYVNLCVNASHPELSWLSGVPGARAFLRAPDRFAPDIGRLAEGLRTVSLGPDQTDFRFVLEDVGIWRCKKIVASNGHTLFFLRRIGETPPSFENRSFHFPHWLQGALREATAMGGLILFTGPPGSGKTTSAVATYLDLVRRRGGVGVAIEDPVEFDLNLTFENGCSVQIDVAGHEGGAEAGYAAACQSALRMGGANMGYIGEIRSRLVSAEVVRFSAAAMTLISTLHAPGPLNAIRRLIDLSAPDYGGPGPAGAAIASSLNAVITQCLTGNPKSPDFRILFLAPVQGLVSAEESQSIRGMIRSGKTDLLTNVMATQEARLRGVQATHRTRAARA